MILGVSRKITVFYKGVELMSKGKKLSSKTAINSKKALRTHQNIIRKNENQPIHSQKVKRVQRDLREDRSFQKVGSMTPIVISATMNLKDALMKWHTLNFLMTLPCCYLFYMNVDFKNLTDLMINFLPSVNVSIAMLLSISVHGHFEHSSVRQVIRYIRRIDLVQDDTLVIQYIKGKQQAQITTYAHCFKYNVNIKDVKYLKELKVWKDVLQQEKHGKFYPKEADIGIWCQLDDKLFWLSSDSKINPKLQHLLHQYKQPKQENPTQDQANQTLNRQFKLTEKQPGHGKQKDEDKR